MKKLLSVSALLAASGIAPVALADPRFAAPPEGFPAEDGGVAEAEPSTYIVETARSTVRAGLGPALLVSSQSTEGGFAAMFDFGARAAGARLSGAWLNVGGDHGLSQYAAEIWIDFGVGRQLHPVLAAGAGLARIDGTDAAGEASRATVGVGTLRGTLEYVLPIDEADARAGIDVTGSVPAIRGERSSAPGEPWLLAVARVGVGF